MRTRPHFQRHLWVAALVIVFISGCSAFRPACGPSSGRSQRCSFSSKDPKDGSTPSRLAKRRAEAALWALVPPDLEIEVPQTETAVFEAAAEPQPDLSSEFTSDHPRVGEFVGKFETKRRDFFARAFDRSGRYVPLMMEILEEEGLPPELAYLPLIESAYRPDAVSHAGAVGPWQFIQGTGKRYGLRMDRYVDDRRDPEKSTRAAARYLKDLYEMFGNWSLSLAAYNTGEMRISRIQDTRGVDSFWDMMEQGYLHPETRDYVPMFFAIVQIARAPQTYGFDDIVDDPVSFEIVKVDRSVSLDKIAELAGASAREVIELNPALIRRVTPPDRDGYEIRIPAGSSQTFATRYAKWTRYAAASKQPVASGAAVYRVRKGDTPASIAKRFGVSVETLMRLNGWKDPRRLIPGQRVRFPAPPKSGGTRVASASGETLQIAAGRTARP